MMINRLSKTSIFAMFAFLSIYIVGCSQSSEPNYNGDLLEIYGVPYMAFKTRSDGGSWHTNSGDLFLLLNGTSSEVGTISRVFNRFGDNPCPIGSTCICTGKVAQGFSSISGSGGESQNSNPPYSIFGSQSISDQTDINYTAPIVYTYSLQLSSTTNTLSATCRSEPNRIISMFRLSNGDIIIQDGSYQVAYKKK